MGASSRTKTQQTFLQCTECDNVFTIHRKLGKLREKNHIKHMYCYKCRDVQAHVEVKEDVFIPKWLREWLHDQDIQEEARAE